MIKYIGSKRLLVPVILDIVAALPDVRVVADLFSGTSRVGQALKQAGYRVIANDHNAYAETLARCYVQADQEDWAEATAEWCQTLNALPGEPGYLTKTFCEDSRYLHPKNGARIDAIRQRIAAVSLDPELEAVLLAALIEAADRVDSTAGVQMAYLKKWAPRAHNDLQLRPPDLAPRAEHGKGLALGLDANDAAATPEVQAADLVYLDPPYNQHSYLGNYHVWETIVRGDTPETYGVANKRVDVRDRASAYNSRRRILDALTGVIDSLRSRYILVSFNNEGFIDRETMETLLSRRGTVTVLEHDYPRYVGAKIGIYNPSGKRVGKVRHLRNRELLYLVTPDGTQLPSTWSGVRYLGPR